MSAELSLRTRSPRRRRLRALLGALQQFLQAGHALARRRFRRPGAAPVRLERDRTRVAIPRERAELPDVIDDALAHRRPLGLPAAEIDDVLQVHVRDAPLRNLRV